MIGSILLVEQKSYMTNVPSFYLLDYSPSLPTILHLRLEDEIPFVLVLYKILFFFSLILVSLSIDLSGYVGDLAKPFATQLHANDDSTRESAVKCVASLALKCSDSEAILTLLKSIFAVLNGSEGKLTVADHKISLLNAVASLADNSILGKCFICGVK